MKYILAGSYQQAKYVAKTLKLEPREYVLIGDRYSICGRTIEESDEIIRCGNFNKRADLPEIEFELQICRRPHATS